MFFQVVGLHNNVYSLFDHPLCFFVFLTQLIITAVLYQSLFCSCSCCSCCSCVGHRQMLTSCFLLSSVFNRPYLVFKSTSSVFKLSHKLSRFNNVFAISPKIFTAKLQFLHNTVAHIIFPSCHFQTLQYMLRRSERPHSAKKYPFPHLEMHCKVQKMTTMIECSVLYHIMKELKLTIEYPGRYKTKPDLTTFWSIFQNIHC